EPTEPVSWETRQACHRSAPCCPTTTHRTPLQQQPASPSQSILWISHHENHVAPSHSPSLIGPPYSNARNIGKRVCESSKVRSICDLGISSPLHPRCATAEWWQPIVCRDMSQWDAPRPGS